MSDTRVRVPLGGKTIHLEQLAEEVGADLTASDTEVVVADEDSKVTAADLQKALDAHVPPQPSPVIAPLSDDEITAVRAMLARNA